MAGSAKKHVAFRLEKPLAEQLRQIARQSERTVSQQLRVAVKEHVRSYQDKGDVGEGSCSR
jgi:hypothetical protein